MKTPRRAWAVFGRLEAGLSGLVTTAAILSLVAIVTIVFIAVILRYGFNIALIFSYDVSTVLFAWLIFLGLYVAEKDGAHMGIDLTPGIANPRLRRGVVLIQRGLLLGTSLYLTWIGIGLVERTGNQIPSLRVSARWLYTAMPIGFGLLSLAYLMRFLQALRPGREV